MSGWVNEWVSAWVNEWTSEWVSGWVSECVSEWVNEWVSEWVSGCVSDGVRMSEWMRGWVHEWVHQWMSELVGEWMSKCISKWVDYSNWYVSLANIRRFKYFFFKKTENHSNRLDILQGIELQEKEENKDKKHIEKLMTKSPIINGENIPCKAEWWIYIDQAHS